MYDLNGSLVDDGGSRSFEWDGANRLVAINYTGSNLRSEFTYDGLNRCVKIVEKTGNTVNSTRQFVLCGTDKCEYRNANGNLQRQLFAQGEYQGGNGYYYYTRDHLGSIREMTDVNGTVVARYDYDPWGRSNTVIGTNKPEFNFTGLYQHTKSGLGMATYRFYDPDLGRWLNRDPIGEAGGINLFEYVGNSPGNLVDPLGLFENGADLIQWGRTLAPAAPAVVPVLEGLGATAALPITGAAALGAGAGYLINQVPGVSDSVTDLFYSTFYNQRGRNESGQSNYLNDIARERARANGTSECAELEELMRQARCSGDTQLARRIRQAQKAAGCRRHGHQN